MNYRLNLNSIEKPYIIKLGFSKLIDQLEETQASGTGIDAELATCVLDKLKDRDALFNGFDVTSDYKDHEEDINNLLSTLFSKSLTKNEIKAALSPMSTQILNTTERFCSIFGHKTELAHKEFDSLDEDSAYIMMCSFILGMYYCKPLAISVPSVYEVVDERGITKYYKSLYNADFISFYPLEEAPVITDETVATLSNNYENISMWKELFPPGSWVVSGFGIKNFVHISGEESLSRIKDLLIEDSSNSNAQEFRNRMNSYMSTLLDVPNVESVFIMYDQNTGHFVKTREDDNSLALKDSMSCDKIDILCQTGLDTIFRQRKDFIVSDVDAVSEETQHISIYRDLKDQGLKSYIMTPLYDGNDLLGVIEIASKQNGSFHKTHVYKIEEMKVLCINAIKRAINERENQLSSVIQHEFTSIHPSVEWRFRQEAEKSMEANILNQEYEISKIKFSNLTALFGQIDISGSSHARNDAIAADLQEQMDMVKSIVESVKLKTNMPLLDSILRNEDYKISISSYFNKIGEGLEVIYNKRKDYDETVKMINLHLANRMDKEQESAQIIYPHFFERYKTDGVEHNMYIGQEITPDIPYSKLYLDNLRLWQLKTMCELEIEHHNRLDKMPVPLQVASLIMVYSNPLAIRYRMDEKQFDIDGAYNARYEIIKKRIDKAHISGTTERITQPGKIVIIYTQPHDLDEYLNYANYLSYQGYITGEPELFNIEDLQGVIGLKGLRVNVNYNYKVENATHDEDEKDITKEMLAKA